MTRWIRDTAADTRLAARALSKRRGFTLTVAITLGLGIAANTAMFSFVDASLLRPPPFDEPDRLVILYRTQAGDDHVVHRTRWSYPRFALLRARLTLVRDVASFNRGSNNVAGGDGGPERVEGESVSPQYFSALRVRPAIGRTLSVHEDAARGANPVVVISDALWRRRFGSDANVVGKTLRANAVPLTIIGVMPAGFTGLTGRAEYWIANAMAPELHYRDHLTSEQNFISIVGRLAPGVNAARAQAELAVAVAGVNAELPSPSTRSWVRGAQLVPLAEARADPHRRGETLVLFGAVGLVLLIACVNLASLLLVRGVSRARETAIRLALGASRPQLVRQLLTESVMLAMLGGVVGVVLAIPGTRVLLGYAAPRIASGANDYAQLSEFADVRLDGRALAFALAASLVTGVVVGLVPALRATRPDLTRALRGGSGGDARIRGIGGRLNAHGLLVVTQIALALTLLVGAGLLLESFTRLRGLLPGFDAEGLMTFWINPGEARYQPADAPRLIRGVLDRVRAVPGVQSATVSRCTPYMSTCASTLLYVAGRDNGAPGTQPEVGRHYVGADHFKTLRIPLLRGRAFTDRDDERAQHVAVINQTAARTFWPNEDPIGQRIWFSGSSGFGSSDSAATIVGIVGDVTYWPINAPIGPDIYTPYAQFTYPSTMVMVRSAMPASALVPVLRAAVSAENADLPIYDVRSMRERAAGAIAAARFNAGTLAGFAVLALLLASIGIYGVMAHTVAQRTREMGIRMALGATRARVARLVAREALRLAVIGIAIGAATTLALTSVLRSQLYGVSAFEPTVYVGIAGLVAGVALIATLIPARAATRVEPVVALKAE
ncbi:MAG: ABC transporter permease [Gemmatimonadota bacterium]|nr:ABC transporter permease [Gemmatimonadota bacterium]